MCKPNYPVAKFGEEDLRICEEECYEAYFNKLLEVNDKLHHLYESEYMEEFTN